MSPTIDCNDYLRKWSAGDETLALCCTSTHEVAGREAGANCLDT